MSSLEQIYGTFTRFSMPSNASHKNVSIKVIIDLVLLSIFSGCLDFFYDYLTPFERGFFCDDEDIMYPHKENTISNATLWSTMVIVPLSVMTLTETVRHMKGFNTNKQNEVYFLGWKVPYPVQQLYFIGGVFLFGIVMSEFAANFTKYIIGRLRPSFLDLCKPDFNCSEIGIPNFYVKEFKCTNSDLFDQNDPRISFPSGHTAVSTYAMVYTVLYIQRKVHFNISFLLKPLIQFMLLLLSTYISITRLQDNQHHWDDIFAGFIIGFVICLLMVFTQTDLFKDDDACSTDKMPKMEF